jgi:hypothetical protein
MPLESQPLDFIQTAARCFILETAVVYIRWLVCLPDSDVKMLSGRDWYVFPFILICP